MKYGDLYDVDQIIHIGEPQREPVDHLFCMGRKVYLFSYDATEIYDALMFIIGDGPPRPKVGAGGYSIVMPSLSEDTGHGQQITGMSVSYIADGDAQNTAEIARYESELKQWEDTVALVKAQADALIAKGKK